MPNRLIQSFVEMHLRELLKDLGYRRLGSVWSHRENATINVLDIQDYVPSKGVVNFTINLGITAPGIYEIVYNRMVPQWVPEVECAVRMRIGFLLEGKRDLWWRLDASSDLDTIARDVEAVIQNHAVGFFRRLDTLEAIRKYMIGEKAHFSNYGLDRINLAAIEFLVGNLVRSKVLLESVNEISAWSKRANDIVARIF